MGDSSAAAPSKSKEAGAKNQKQPLLDSRRRSELLGFLVAVAGLLILLSLASYLPEDPSLNTSAGLGPRPGIGSGRLAPTLRTCSSRDSAGWLT